MDDNNLDYIITNSLPLKHDYVGTFTSDNIVHNPLLKINFTSKRDVLLSFIANTLEASNITLQEGHWVAFILCKSKRGLSLKYFDSFGDSPRKYPHFSSYISSIKDRCYAHKIPFKLDRIKRPIQAPYSKFCGPYAAYAIIKSHRERHTPLKKIFAPFSTNRRNNDRKIEYFLTKQWPSRSCHTNPIYYNMKMSLNLLKKQPPFCPKINLSTKKCFKKCLCQEACCLENNV